MKNYQYKLQVLNKFITKLKKNSEKKGENYPDT